MNLPFCPAPATTLFIDCRQYSQFAAKALHPNTAVVSADVFDTLLLRTPKPECQRFLEIGGLHLDFLRRQGYAPTSTPADLLTLRIMAARAAYRNIPPVAGVREAKYTDFMTIVLKALACPLDFCDPLRKIELDYERSALYPNEVLIRIFKAAATAGKRIIWVSDMYFSHADIASLVAPHVPELRFDRGYASSDYGLSKASGLLYPLIAEQEKVKTTQIAHCGDSRHSDFTMARRHGVEAVFVPRALPWRVIRQLWQKLFHRRYGIV